MEVVILCGGKGTRLSEETETRPKPMVEIGGMPILWHIMKTYSFYGYKKFILALGYKANFIKEYFYNLRISGSDFTLKMTPDHNPHFYNALPESDWEITFVDTGEETLKGAREKELKIT
jgi:glucose-1-phosphate cytidylyltransferase